MDRSLRVLCALLVVALALAAATPPAGGARVDDPRSVRGNAQVQPLSGQNTTSVLLLTGETTNGYASSTVDVAPVVDAAHGVGEIELRERIIERRLQEASTVDEQRQVLRQETEQVSEQVAELQGRERRALSRYERGEISAEELLRVLATVDTEARRANELVSLLQDEAAQVPFLSSTSDELQSLQIELATLYGPVREHAGEVLRGNALTTRVQVSVSGEAVAIATIRGDTYVREVTVPENLDTETTDQFESENEVISRIGTLYPWAWTSETSSVRTYTNFENGFYRIDVDHAHGRLTSYVDGGTKNVFREIQYKSVERMPPGQQTVARANGTVLRMNQSFVGGPVEVRTLNATTAEPVEGVVYLDGTRVGRTTNGREWLVGPSGEYEVTVVTDAGNVTVTGQALQ
jgi:transcriptional regulator with XRE-family HTH domain